MSSGLNRLAARISELLAHERETLADLSHQLRTPLTALRIDAESLRDEAEMMQLSSDVDALTRSVDQVIRQARRPSQADGRAACDAAEVVWERTSFWRALAEDQSRYMQVDISADWLPVKVPAQDLATCVDILLENVFAHTPEGAAFAVRLTGREGGGAWLAVSDRPGLRGARPCPARAVRRRLHRTRPGYRQAHRRDIRRIADDRAFTTRRCGDHRRAGADRSSAQACEPAPQLLVPATGARPGGGPAARHRAIGLVRHRGARREPRLTGSAGRPPRTARCSSAGRPPPGAATGDGPAAAGVDKHRHKNED